MNLIEEINKLPEGSNPVSILPYFHRAIAELSKIDAFEALVDLSDKQWHTYEMLDPETSIRVSNWLLLHWDRNSLEDAEMLTSIVSQLGLSVVFRKMSDEFPRLPNDVQIEFKDFFEEIGDSIGDPYSGM